MKIIIATPIYPPAPGGPATYTWAVSEKLATHHDVEIVAYATADRIDPPSGVTLSTVSERLPLPLRLVLYIWRLWRRSAHADVIYAQNAVAAGLPAVLVGRLRCLRVVIKFVGDEAWERARLSGYSGTLDEFYSTTPPTRYTRLLKHIQHIVLTRADIVTTPSHYLRAAIVSAYQLPQEHVVTNYNTTEICAPPTLPRTNHSIAVVNRLAPWKHVDQILYAVATLRHEFPDITLTIAGDGSERAALATLTQSLKLHDCVTFRGTVDRKDVQKLLACSSVYVLNSSYEGLPFTVLEAFATKTPVIATGIPGTNELVTTDTGYPTASPDATDVANALRTVFTKPTEAAARAQTAHSLLTQQFSWTEHLHILETLLPDSGQFSADKP